MRAVFARTVNYLAKLGGAGAGPGGESLLARGLTYLRAPQHNLQNVVARETLGPNLSYTVLTRTPAELKDQFISQFGGTAVAVGPAVLLDKTINRLFRKAFGADVTGNAKEWLAFGKSTTILTVLTGALFGIPLFRNTYTASQTGTNQFAEIIGERHKSASTARQDHHQSLQETLDWYKKLYTGSWLGSAGLAAAILGGSMLMARRSANIPKAVASFQKHLGIKDGKIGNLSMLSTFMFWTVPLYGGFLAGSRDNYERLELLIRFIAFNLNFFVLPNYFRKLAHRAFQNVKPNRLFGSKENMSDFFGEFLSSAILCSTTPTLINIQLTKYRVQRDTLTAMRDALQQAPLTHKKSFSEFIHFSNRQGAKGGVL